MCSLWRLDEKVDLAVHFSDRRIPTLEGTAGSSAKTSQVVFVSAKCAMCGRLDLVGAEAVDDRPDDIVGLHVGVLLTLRIAVLP